MNLTHRPAEAHAIVAIALQSRLRAPESLAGYKSRRVPQAYFCKTARLSRGTRGYDRSQTHHSQHSQRYLRQQATVSKQV